MLTLIHVPISLQMVPLGHNELIFGQQGLLPDGIKPS